jgi:Flp pilus assembly protein TadD
LRHESKQYVDSAINYLKQKKYHEAAIELRNAIKKNPEDSEAYLLLARVQIRLGQTREAVESYQKAISLSPSQYESHLELSRLVFALKNTSLAQAEATEAAKLQPAKPEPLLLLAQIHSAAGKYDLALEQCRAIAGKEFSTPELRLQFITLLLRLRAFALAYQVTEEGLKVTPNDTTLKIMQAEALAGLGLSAEADVVFQNAASADPASPNPFIALGGMLMQRGDYVGALESYEEALKRAPGNDLVMNNIASLTAEHGFDMDRAAALSSRLYAKYPKNAAVADTLGWTLFRQGKTGEAVPLLKQGVAGMPGNPVHRYHLGVALQKSGNQTAGRKELETSLRISGNFDGAVKARALLAEKN